MYTMQVVHVSTGYIISKNHTVAKKHAKFVRVLVRIIDSYSVDAFSAKFPVLGRILPQGEKRVF